MLLSILLSHLHSLLLCTTDQLREETIVDSVDGVEEECSVWCQLLEVLIRQVLLEHHVILHHHQHVLDAKLINFRNDDVLDISDFMSLLVAFQKQFEELLIHM